MASFNITGASTTAQLLISGEYGYIGVNGSLVTTSNAILVGTGATSVNLVVDGAVFAPGGRGVSIGQGADVTISNAGHISAFLEGIYNLNSGTVRVFNTGVIEALRPSNDGILLANGGHRIVNSGTITGTDDGIQIAAPVGAMLGTWIWNTGLIATDSLTGHSLYMGEASDQVVNQGTLLGDVRLNGGNDLFDGRGGTVTGEVAGGIGDDLYILDDPTLAIVELAGSGNDTIRSAAEGFVLPDNVEVLELIGDARAGYGNAGANVIIGSLHDNVLAGRDGADSVDGGAGRDSLYGGAGNDTLRGEEGDDYLRGGPGDDLIGGGDQDDFLQGSEGADSLYGGGGQDRLWGGMGPDVLYGGADADTFAFGWAAESPGGAGRDRIMDFERGLDRIDLANVDADATIAGNQAFQFIGTAAFTAAGQVRYAVVGPDVIVGADVDGDGLGDLTILVAGVAALTADDFFL